MDDMTCQVAWVQRGKEGEYWEGKERGGRKGKGRDGGEKPKGVEWLCVGMT